MCTLIRRAQKSDAARPSHHEYKNTKILFNLYQLRLNALFNQTRAYNRQIRFVVFEFFKSEAERERDKAKQTNSKQSKSKINQSKNVETQRIYLRFDRIRCRNGSASVHNWWWQWVEQIFVLLVIPWFIYWLPLFVSCVAVACVIDVQKDLGEPQPLLLDPSTDDFLYPHSSQGLIEIDARETIKLYCSNGFRTPLTSNGSESLLATCVSRKTFSVNKQKIDFSKIACNDAPAHTQKRTNETCSSGVIVEIGFQTDRKWLRLMRVCHNEERGATNWVQYNQKPENRAYQRSSKRVDFRQGDGFYEGLQVDELYSKNIQRLTCACILNSTPLCNELIPVRFIFIFICCRLE